VGTTQLTKNLCHLAGRALPDVRLARAQLWLWFIGMIVALGRHPQHAAPHGLFRPACGRLCPKRTLKLKFAE
jgi:hypothetical protein